MSMKKRDFLDFKFKYKNLVFLFISFILAYFLLKSEFLENVIEQAGSYGYVGVLFIGMFFSYGLTTPIALAVFYKMGAFYNPFILAAIGAVGAIISDYLIFKLVKDVLWDEIILFMKENKIKFPRLKKFLTKNKWGSYVLPMIAGFIIASPLPDELGAALFAMIKFDIKKFIFIAYFLNFSGLLVTAYLGSL